MQIDKKLIAMQKNIKALNMNGLKGRMLQIPSPAGKSRRILMVYGHHASLERVYGIAEAFNDYGEVIIPDLPGFGGMESFYRIGMKPTLDNYADYMASFIKLKYKNKKVTIAGMSLGFVIITRMLQRYPEMAKQVDLLISVVGFSHWHDMTFSYSRMLFYRTLTKIFRNRVAAAFFYNVVLHPALIRAVYGKTHNAKKKLANLNAEEFKVAINFEVHLWRSNDVRTYMYTGGEMLKLDNCKKSVELVVNHISIDSDQYFDNNVVEQHMRVIFNDFTNDLAKLPNHAPSIIASKKEASALLPLGIRQKLRGTS